MWALLLALVVGVLCAEVGRRLGAPKDRAVPGMVWGLLLGPLGWIVILLSPDLRHPIDRGFRVCRSCSGEIPLEADECGFCGKRSGPMTEQEAWREEFERTAR